MAMLASPFTHTLLVATAVAAAPAAHALSCDELRAAVEAKIQAKGVRQFAVTVVAADAAASGPVVGTCDLGRKKLVYTREAAAPARKAVVTECADGRVVAQGDCKK